jgi:hypothetical protein
VEPSSQKTVKEGKTRTALLHQSAAQSGEKSDRAPNDRSNEKTPGATPAFKLDVVGDEVVFMPDKTGTFDNTISSDNQRASMEVPIEIIAKKSPTKIKKPTHKRSMSNESGSKLSKKSMSTSQPANEKSWRVPLPFKRTTSPPRPVAAPGAAKKEPEPQKPDLNKAHHQKFAVKKEVINESAELKQSSCKDYASDKQGSWMEETPIGQSLEVKDKPLASKLKFSHHQKQVSAQVDQLAEIHLEKDPIDASLHQRKGDGGCVKSVVRCRTNTKTSTPFFFTLKVKAPEREMPLALMESHIPAANGESPIQMLGESQPPRSSSPNPTPITSEGRTYTHFLNSNIDNIQEEEIKAAAEEVAFSIDTKARSRHKRNQSLHHVLQVKNFLGQEGPPQELIQDCEGELGDSPRGNEMLDGSINIIIEPQEQEDEQRDCLA